MNIQNDISICTNCFITSVNKNKPLEPNIKEDSKVLFLFDYPSYEDIEDGIVFSGLSKRLTTVHKIIKGVDIDDSTISYATCINCVTRSKSISIKEYSNCFKHTEEYIKTGKANIIMCFGSVAYQMVTGKELSSIDEVRGKVFDTKYEGIRGIATYALSYITDGGCGNCRKSIIPYLTKKDIEEILVPELKKI